MLRHRSLRYHLRTERDRRKVPVATQIGGLQQPCTEEHHIEPSASVKSCCEAPICKIRRLPLSVCFCPSQSLETRPLGRASCRKVPGGCQDVWNGDVSCLRRPESPWQGGPGVVQGQVYDIIDYTMLQYTSIQYSNIINMINII